VGGWAGGVGGRGGVRYHEAMDWREYIHSDPAILGGKPVIKGTRISVELILEKLAFQTFDEILLDYPHLNRPQLQAAVLFVSDALRDVLSSPRLRREPQPASFPR
jgi:uncharacterized protein (DUF433 family)